MDSEMCVCVCLHVCVCWTSYRRKRESGVHMRKFRCTRPPDPAGLQTGAAVPSPVHDAVSVQSHEVHLAAAAWTHRSKEHLRSSTDTTSTTMSETIKKAQKYFRFFTQQNTKWHMFLKDITFESFINESTDDFLTKNKCVWWHGGDFLFWKPQKISLFSALQHPRGIRIFRTISK